MARLQNNAEELAYRIYISDSLHAQGEGMYMAKRYIDIIKPEKHVAERSADDIAEDIIMRMGLKVGGEK